MNDFGCFLLFTGHDLQPGLYERYPRAQSRKGLSHFATDRPGANDRETRGQFGEGKHGLIGEVSRFFQTLDGGRNGARAGGDKRPGKHKALPRHHHRVATVKSGLPEKDINTQLCEARHGIVVAKPCAKAPHTFHNRTKIDPGLSGHVDAESCGITDIGRGVCTSDQRLAGNASHIQAVPPHKTTFDKRHLGAQTRRAGSGD
ncbi:MAG: hypothetical protein AMXMBFR4_19220 [Candidatus Hydrogenedentota bacterium]